jgi:hypothetical protein
MSMFDDFDDERFGDDVIIRTPCGSPVGEPCLTYLVHGDRGQVCQPCELANYDEEEG